MLSLAWRILWTAANLLICSLWNKKWKWPCSIWQKFPVSLTDVCFMRKYVVEYVHSRAGFSLSRSFKNLLRVDVRAQCLSTWIILFKRRNIVGAYCFEIRTLFSDVFLKGASGDICFPPVKPLFWTTCSLFHLISISFISVVNIWRKHS